jgi:hypothetical protein
MRGKDLSNLDWKPATDPDGLAAYNATDHKGRGYSLVRNNHRPEMMFVVSDGLSVPPGWYTDKAGTIKRVS